MSEDPRKRLGEYETISKIASGGFGCVLKARNRSTGAIVAIKQVRVKPDAYESRTAIPTFAQREIEALSKFGSDPRSHILPLLDHIFLPEERSLYLIFKYYPYDLRALVLAKSFTEDSANLCLREICHALRTLHRARYVHRDVKPENIFVSSNHSIALGDFGLARSVGSPMTAGAGTLYYQAPEELLGDTEYGPPVDIWALGCLMFFLVTGEVLFQGKSEADQFQQICSTIGSPSPEDWPGLLALPNAVMYLPKRFIVREDIRKVIAAKMPDGKSDAYIDLMAEMLQWNPNKRITAEAALNHELFGKIGCVGYPVIVTKEAHQRERSGRPFCDFLIEGFDEDLEFPRFVPEYDP